MKEEEYTTTKLAICDFTGKARDGYEVVKSVLVADEQKTTQSKQIGHLIVVIDRSGSMYYDINQLKETLIQLLTLDQFLNTGLMVTIISYSGHGDVTLHFERTPIDDVMQSDSKYLKQIRNIRATYLTCISQAMEMAKGLVKNGELTGICLHSDGFANDYSVSSEKRELARICEEMQKMNIFVNTIAYSERSDFQLLSQVANSVSGSAVLARNPKEVYQAFLASAEGVSSGTAVTVDLPIGNADYQIFIDEVSGRIIGSADDLSVKGVDPQDGKDCYVLRYFADGNGKAPTSGIDEITRTAAYAYARAMVSDGDINTAKFAMNSSLNSTITAAHARALTSIQLGEMCTALDNAVFNGDDGSVISDTAQFAADGISIIELCGLLSSHRGSILINRKHLAANYNRRGLKKVRGVRNDKGELEEPWLDTEYLDNSDFVQMGTLNVNTNTATVNLNIARPIRLVKKSDKTPVTEVAGVMLDLMDFKNYTIVGDGEVNIPEIEVRFSSKDAFQALTDAGVVTGNAKYSHDTVYTINLASMPVCPYDIEVEGVQNAFRKLAGLKVVSSILSAHVKGESTMYTREQLDELKQHYLSANLYVNFPTTNEYTSLEEALRSGLVDTRVSYRIDVGDTEILNMSKFLSANAFLQRMYNAADSAKKNAEKPTMDMNLENYMFTHKTLTSRTKITPVDDFMKPIFDAFLGLGPVDALADILVPLGCVALVEAVRKGERGDDFVAKIEHAAKVVDEASATLWREAVCPLVFYIGSTGLVPDELGLEIKTAEELQSANPELKLAKKELDGSFFVHGSLVVSVYASNEYYSTRK